MNYTSSLALAALALATANSSATTTLTSANFDLDADATWDSGLPGPGNDGIINANYNFDDMGSGNTNGNFTLVPGTYSLTQTAGDGLGDQWNLNGNSDFTFNLNGGTKTSDGGTFFVNGYTYKIDGGSLTKTGGESRIANGAEFNLASGSYSATNTRLIGGSITVSGGTFSSDTLDLEGGTFTQTGGTVTTTHATLAIAQSVAGGKIANLEGGTFVNDTATALVASSNVTVNIGGDFVFDATSATGLFNSISGTSTIDFASDWTGSLILDSSTAWDDVFEAEGRVSVDGAVLNPGEFEFFFQNTSGVITLSIAPQPATAKWTGLGGSTWDFDSTANFASNEPADPLNNTTFDVATSVVNAVIFDDTYEFNGGSTGVGSFAVDVASGGISDTAVTFSNDSNAYVVSSPDANGISGTTSVTTSGASTVTLLGTHAYTGATMIEAGTLNLGDGSTDGSIVDSAITNDSALIVHNTGSITHNAIINGNGSFEKLGAGTLTLAANYLNGGSVTLTGGDLVFQGVPRASSHSIASSTVLELNSAGGFNIGAGFDTTFTGTGTLISTGMGTLRWGEAKAVFELGSGALIDVQNGLFVGASHGNVASRAEEWTNNLSDLHVESDATFNGSEGNIRVNVLTGGGTIASGGNPATTGYTGFTFGVDDGSGTFDGVLDNNGTLLGNFTKVGSGTQTLTGINLYTGNTTVTEGTLTLASGGELTMAPEANGVCNVIAGAAAGSGVIQLDGALYLELIGADITNGNSWLLVDDTDLSVNYGATFSVSSPLGLFTETAGVWTLMDGDNEWTFTEATGILSLVAPDSGYATWLGLYPTLSDTSPTGDPEKDGIENTLEYVLNGNPEVSDPSILPTLDTSGADFVFTFTRREESANDTTQVFQYGSDLMGWTDLNITPPTATEVTLGTPADGLQTVTVTISKSLAVDGKLFGRLTATLNE
ncbi:beta strand repeat-containing protein [Haloferula rosea]|uniref:Autotransporter-associated beta strand repeat-containing protein n=1 Tax=Haloferula rosea TaxID=490093 RepID=A0A934R9F9_9BACT|nr:autotransporter-associated beta strand repeat-containing protein [Haloferula rosea]MBK1825522.1 autotransporter-associated beta strand repeat-containing protein [Haloferula rosea]